MRRAPHVKLSPEQKAQLWAAHRDPTLDRRHARRVRIVLAAARGMEDRQIAATLRVNRLTVALWRKRFIAGGYEALVRKPVRTGRPRAVSDSTAQKIMQLRPQDYRRWGARQHAHWGVREAARQTGVSDATVRRIWQGRRIP